MAKSYDLQSKKDKKHHFTRTDSQNSAWSPQMSESNDYKFSQPNTAQEGQIRLKPTEPGLTNMRFNTLT